MTVDLAAVERELQRIPEVRAARIVADETGSPVEVHVLAVPGKAPKQLVRDVQSVAIATQGLDIDHRIVSIVQLDEPVLEAALATAPTPQGGADGESGSSNGAPEDATDGATNDTTNGANGANGTGQATAERPTLGRIQVERHGSRCTAVVTLRAGERTAEGSASGSVAQASARRVVAEATLDALHQLCAAVPPASVDAVNFVRVGDREVVVAAITLVVPPYEEVVSGSAPVRVTGPDDAVARAVLDACNRRLFRLAPR